MTDANAEVNSAFAELLYGFRKDRIKAESAKAKADPKANKNTKVFDAKKMDYRHYDNHTVLPKQTVRWCWSLHKNVAGYYLSWIEVLNVGKGGGARCNYTGWKTKRDAIADCRARYFDALKPKGERRYTTPTYDELVKRGGHW